MFEAHRLWYHATVDLRVITKKFIESRHTTKSVTIYAILRPGVVLEIAYPPVSQALEAFEYTADSVTLRRETRSIILKRVARRFGRGKKCPQAHHLATFQSVVGAFF